MTLVEFFDKSALENIAGALLCEPEKVIFIGDSRKVMEKSIARYRRILDVKKIPVEFSYRSINKNDLQNTIEVLSGIAEQNDDCIFDLTGGEDIYLVAVGVVMEKFRGNVQCHRFNFGSSSLIDCDCDGNVCKTKSFNISIEENINIHGGTLLGEGDPDYSVYDWDLNDDFIDDVNAMWGICRKNGKKWNSQIHTLGMCDRFFGEKDSLQFRVLKQTGYEALRQADTAFDINPAILLCLEKSGMIRNLTLGEEIRFQFKNAQVKRCLTVAGQILELIIATRMRALTDKKRQNLYHDVKVGGFIDWDEVTSSGEFRTVNEIDVLAMKGAVPIFISCKNGDFFVEELYKLNAVCDRFGGKYAKKILVASELDKMKEDKVEYIRARAEDMGIRLIEDVDTMTDAALNGVLKEL